MPYRHLVFFYLILSLLVRIVLWAGYGPAGQVRWTHIPTIVAIGAVQDLAALVFLLLPASLMALLPGRLLTSGIGRAGLAVLSFAAIYGLLFLAPAEVLFFDEFNSRFNLVAVDYFAYPTEVFGNIWESYPIVWCVLGIFVVCVVVWRVLWPGMAAAFASTQTGWARLRFFVLHLALAILLAVFGSVEWLPANQNRVQTEITQNGILTFFRAMRTNDIEFDHFYATIDRDRAYGIMRNVLKEKGGEFVSEDPTNLTRRFAGKADGLGKLNVVIVGEESLGAQYISALGDSRKLTPNFDRISTEGLLFENAFATGTRTVRGLEAISMSFPPIPSESTVKRPNNEGMANLGQLLSGFGYTPSFIYGGFGAFDNMNYFFGHNGFNLVDRLSVEKVRYSNIWGVCDEDLFDQAVKEFDRESSHDRPFFSIIMTTSNHKPFTFRPGLENIPESGGGREAGVRYADVALGHFFDQARNKPWYRNTIFVVVGDHDSRVYGRAYIPVERFRVAQMIIAPGHIAPRRVPNITSHIDIAPTLMGLLGLPYEAPFFGRDILDPAAPMSQPVLLNHNHDVGLYQNGELAVTSLNRELKMFRYLDVGKTVEIEPDTKMQETLTAYLQTAYEMYRSRTYTISQTSPTPAR